MVSLYVYRYFDFSFSLCIVLPKWKNIFFPLVSLKDEVGAG